MNNCITITLGNMFGDYTLEETPDGNITVSVPYLDHDDDGSESIETNIVQIEKGHKADVVREFFKEESISIMRNGTAYMLDSVLFDQSGLPSLSEEYETIERLF